MVVVVSCGFCYSSGHGTFFLAKVCDSESVCCGWEVVSFIIRIYPCYLKR